MKVVGIVSESSSDYLAISALLKRYYQVEFKEFLKGVNGSNLDLRNNKELLNQLRNQCESTKPEMVVFCRDLDSTIDSLDFDEKMKFRDQFFNRFNTVVNDLGVKLLIIYELEALILADIETFNLKFGTKVYLNGQIENIPNPKEVLIAATADHSILTKYKPAKNPIIFALLDLEKLKQNSPSFNKFLKTFESKLN